MKKAAHRRGCPAAAAASFWRHFAAGQSPDLRSRPPLNKGACWGARRRGVPGRRLPLRHETKKARWYTAGFSVWRSIRDLNSGGAVNALSHFEGRETAKTPYISAQVRIKYVPKACKNGLFSYLVICVRMTLQLHFSRTGTIWAPRAPFRTRRTHE